MRHKSGWQLAASPVSDPIDLWLLSISFKVFIWLEPSFIPLATAVWWGKWSLSCKCVGFSGQQNIFFSSVYDFNLINLNLISLSFFIKAVSSRLRSFYYFEFFWDLFKGCALHEITSFKVNFYWSRVDLQCCVFFLMYNIVNQLYIPIYPFFFRFYSHIGYYRFL